LDITSLTPALCAALDETIYEKNIPICLNKDVASIPLSKGAVNNFTLILKKTLPPA
jgi:hypothetical protein